MKDACRSYRDQALLVLYGEAGSSRDDHASRCRSCRQGVDEWNDVLRSCRANRPRSPSFRSVPHALRAEMRRTRSVLKRAAELAALLVIFALPVIDGTRTEAAFALSDGEIFWTLRSLHREADEIRAAGPGYGSEPLLADLALEIRAVGSDWIAMTDERMRRPPDRLALEILETEIRVLEARLRLEVW